MSNKEAHVRQLAKLTNQDKIRWAYRVKSPEGSVLLEAEYNGVMISFDSFGEEDLYFADINDGLGYHYDLTEINGSSELVDAINSYIERRIAVTLDLDKLLFDDEVDLIDKIDSMSVEEIDKMVDESLNENEMAEIQAGWNTLYSSSSKDRTPQSGQTEEGIFPVESVYKHLKDHCKYKVLPVVEGDVKLMAVPEEFASTCPYELIAVWVTVDKETTIEVTWNKDTYLIDINKGDNALEAAYNSDSVYGVLDRVHDIASKSKSILLSSATVV